MKTLNKIIIKVLALAFLFLSYVVSNASPLSEKKLKSDQNGHEYVDLGLPSHTLWATCNVGADAPEGYGDYFAWGEIQPKCRYTWITYKYSNGKRKHQLTKYCNDTNIQYNQSTDNWTIVHEKYTDNLYTLQSCDDAATINWGDEWCMPTMVQWEELEQNTISTWTTINGVNGFLFTANNGNSIFLPAAGANNNIDGIRGFYWSSLLSSIDPNYAYFYKVDPDDQGVEYLDRFLGFSVRPVRSGKTAKTSKRTNQKAKSSSSSNKNTGVSTSPHKEITITKKQESQDNQEEIFMIVEEMPQLSDSIYDLNDYIEENIQYPYDAITNCVEGIVTIEFVIEPDGSTSNIKVTKSVGSGCDEEAVRLIETMPKWKPGKRRGEPVRVQNTMNIRFAL